MRPRFTKYLTSNASTSLVLMALLCLVSTQALALAHDLTHADHEDTDICEIISSFGTNKDYVSVESASLPQQLQNQQLSSIWVTPLFGATLVQNRRSRAPPSSPIF